MNKLHKLLMAGVALFARSFNFANAEAANADAIPMVGEQFDYRKMVLNLLGCPEDAPTDMVNERYKKAMGVACNEALDEDLQRKLATAELAHAANVELKSRWQAAEARVKELEAANEQPREVKIKLGGKEIDAANAEALQVAETEVNERVTKAEAAAANARQSLRKFVLAALVREGRLTKAQAEQEDANLAKPEFANAEQFDARVAELAKKESALGIASGSSIFGMLEKLGEAANTKGVASTTPSSEFMNMVNAEMEANGGDYERAWAKVKLSDKGKGLLASMKQPTTHRK